MKVLKAAAIILGSAVLMWAAGWYGTLWIVGALMDKSNPQDPTGWLAIFAIPAGIVGFLIGATIGTIIVVVRHRHRSSV